MHPKEIPIFYDQTGKRWLVTENILVLFIAIIGIVSYWLVPQVFAIKRPPQTSINAPATSSEEDDPAVSSPSVETLMNAVASKNIPVIGDGPLVRVVRVEKNSGGTFISEPFLHHTLKSVDEADEGFIGSNEYLLQRYGAKNDKVLALTFDDGPSAAYTAELLDLLSKESVPATFFVTGGNAAKSPELMERIVREGHAVGNHTFSHINFDTVSRVRGEQEINQSQRLIAATTGHDTAFFRPPYDGNSDQALRNNLKGILTAQRLGYTVTSFDFDTSDWMFPSGKEPEYPALEGESSVVLLHDGGGNRSRTVDYVKTLVHLAKSKGYSFASLQSLYPETGGAATAPALADKASLFAVQAVLVWSQDFIIWLFIFSLVSLVIISLLNTILAIFYRMTVKYQPRSKKFAPKVSIIVPAYNEETVIEKTVRSLIASTYQNIEILVIDDGSSDNTWKVARSLEKRYKRVLAIHQQNGGKASALTNAISQSSGEIIICVDADTIFSKKTVNNLIRHFEDESIGAVAGVVKVGNPNSILTRWQALEYISGISIERSAQALLGAIMIVPGACGAWRRSALLEVGGFSSSTLAEDCDLALKIQKLGRYKIVQDNEAISYTEAPQFLGALTKQRFRWTFGNIQSLWKHRSMVGNERYGWLGMYVLPSAIISIVVPILFWPLLITLTIENIITGNYWVLLLFFALSLVVQIILSAIGLILAHERFSLIFAVPFARFTYGPIRVYILYKTILTILKGVDVGWNKLARTGTAYDPLAAQVALAATPSEKSS